MSEFLLVADQVAPVADGEVAAGSAALAFALSAAKHRVTILSLAPREVLTTLPGMARRLRPVKTRIDGAEIEFSLYEGRSAVSQCALYILGAQSTNRGLRATLLNAAANALIHDQICWPDVVLGWGESSALALACAPSATAALILPEGRWDSALSREEVSELDPGNSAVAVSGGTLAGLGAIEADVVLLPCPSSARAFRQASELANVRASDQPVAAIRLGCDELPYDPAADPILAANFSAASPAGKQECRRALLRRASLAMGSRTLLLATGPLDPAHGGREILEAIARIDHTDVAVVFPAGGDRALVDQANVLAMRSPGKIRIFPESGLEAERQILAAADAILLADTSDLTGRPAGRALRYGVLPLAPDAAADGDHLVDYDQASQTGCALLYSPTDAWGGLGAIQRAIALRANSDIWQALLVALLTASPRWSGTAAAIEAICLAPRAA